MKTVLVDHIQCEITKGEVLARFGMPEDHPFGETIAEVIEEMKDIANAKLLYGEAKVEQWNEDSVTIGGTVFQGKDLASRLKGVETVYPYLCTCGTEINDYAWGCKDLVKMLYIDAVMHFYLRQSFLILAEKIDNAVGGRSYCMAPGSFEDWPLTEQKPLFDLLNHGEGSGVTLSDSCIMEPAKSVTGLRFYREGLPKDCALCLYHDCAERERGFDPKRFDDTLC
ncbi:MAG: hypothetical protein ACOX8R_00330 [Bacillota bacterium]|jgi:hypothetical protein